MDEENWFDADEAPVAPSRVLVWADPELDDPSGGAAWWSATHLVYLPTGLAFADLPETGAVEVTISCDVSPLASGLNELSQRFDAEWSTHTPEVVTVDRGRLLRPYDVAEIPLFRIERDLYRVNHGLPRVVVRSDVYDAETKTRAAHHVIRPEWPVGMFMQGGTTTIGRPATPEEIADPDVVVGRNGHAYVDKGVFIEAFPTHPSTFLRGQGVTFAEAEDLLWAKWSRITGCPSPTGSHEYETRGYRNGCGFCVHCGLFSSEVFDLAEIGSVCVVCGVGTYWCHIAKVGPDGQVDRKAEPDLVCEEHAPPDYLTVCREIDAYKAGCGPEPDTSWFEPHLPAGSLVQTAGPEVLHAAIDRGRRAWVDRLVTDASSGNPAAG